MFKHKGEHREQVDRMRRNLEGLTRAPYPNLAEIERICAHYEWEAYKLIRHLHGVHNSDYSRELEVELMEFAELCFLERNRCSAQLQTTLKEVM